MTIILTEIHFVVCSCFGNEGFLYESFRLDRWWIECADELHKFFLTSCIVLLPLDSQLPTGMAIVGFYMLCLFAAHPYNFPQDDRLHLYAQAILLLLFICGNTFRSFAVFDEFYDRLLTAVLIILVSFFFLYFLYGGCVAFYQWKEKRKQRKLDALTGEEEEFVPGSLDAINALQGAGTEKPGNTKSVDEGEEIELAALKSSVGVTRNMRVILGEIAPKHQAPLPADDPSLKPKRKSIKQKSPEELEKERKFKEKTKHHPKLSVSLGARSRASSEVLPPPPTEAARELGISIDAEADLPADLQDEHRTSFFVNPMALAQHRKGSVDGDQRSPIPLLRTGTAPSQIGSDSSAPAIDRQGSTDSQASNSNDSPPSQ